MIMSFRLLPLSQLHISMLKERHLLYQDRISYYVVYNSLQHYTLPNCRFRKKSWSQYLFICETVYNTKHHILYKIAFTFIILIHYKNFFKNIALKVVIRLIMPRHNYVRRLCVSCLIYSHTNIRKRH